MAKPVTQLNFQIIAMAKGQDELNALYSRLYRTICSILAEEFEEDSGAMSFCRSHQHSLDEEFEVEDWGKLARQSFAPMKVVSRSNKRGRR